MNDAKNPVALTMATPLSLARTALDAGRLDEAKGLAQAALRRSPHHCDALGIGAAADFRAGRLAEAATAFGQIYALLRARQTVTPATLAQAAHNLATVLDESGNAVSAEAVYREALALQPARAETLEQCGGLMRNLGRLKDALSLHRLAVRLHPQRAASAYALACTLAQGGVLDEAIFWHRKAIELEPQMHAAHANLGMCHLARGEFELGWPLFEWRWKSSQNIGTWANFRVPLWTGDVLGQRKLLVWAEQGLGDSIQFVRYLALLREKHPDCGLVFRGPRALMRLFERFAQRNAVSLVADDAGLELATRGTDAHVPLMSLPHLMGTRLDSIPSKAPAYLELNPAWVLRWQERIRALGGERSLNLGIVWRGHKLGLAAARRNMRLMDWAPWLKIPGIRWFSLQLGEGVTAEVETSGWRGHLVDWSAELTDFAETASLAAALDLVISVDTSTAHAAAAVGTPVWMLSRFDACWRWMRERTDSPWYPGMRIFRQHQAGAWGPMLESVGDELSNIAASRAFDGAPSLAVDTQGEYPSNSSDSSNLSKRAYVFPERNG